MATYPNNLAGFDPGKNAGDCWYDSEAADRAIGFFHECLQFVDDYKAGQPMLLERWQQDIIRTLFGWKRPDGTRRFRHLFLAIPRKNGKTTMCAGLALFMLLCDGLYGAQCYCAAGDREQASIVYKFASMMANSNPLFKKLTKSNKTSRTLTYANKAAVLKALPANEGAIHGTGPSCVIGDEVHVWKGRDVYDALHTGTGHRAQPLEAYITTAGHDKDTICWELWEHAVNVRDGRIDDVTCLPVLYAADEEDDWTDPEVWAKANPNLGVSVRLDYLEAECKRAQSNPAYENTFRRLHLNQWTSQESRWLQLSHWDKCEAGPGIDASGETFGGLDLSSKLDMTAWMVVEKLAGPSWRCQGHYWLPETKAREYEKQHMMPVSQWVRDGWLTLIPGSVVDVSYVHARILEDVKRHQITAIGYDPWNAEHSRQHLENSGAAMVEVRQGAKTLNEPCKSIERSIVEHTFQHCGDPVLRWMADNVQVKTDENGNIRPVKPPHGSHKKIDGIMALATAISVAGVHESTPVIQYTEGDLWA